MPSIDATARVQTGVFKILRERSALPIAVVAAIQDVQVVNEINVPSMFSFTLSSQSARGAWQDVNLDTFKPGDEITILLGMGTAQEVITGNVTAIEPSFGEYATVTIRGFDRMVWLQFGTHTKVFDNLGEAEIFRQVAQSARLSLQVSDPPTRLNDHVVQNSLSNYDFLCLRCEQLNLELVMKGTTLLMRPSAEGASPARTLNYPKDLSRVALNLKVPTLGEKVTVTGYDVESGSYLSAQSGPGSSRDLMGGRQNGYEQASDFPDSGIAIERPDISSVEALKELADAQYQRLLNRFIEGTASIQGDPAINAGVNLRLTGMSSRFNGTYYVTQSTHSYDDSRGYRTDIKLRRTGA